MSSSLFTPDAVRVAADPPWLQERRLRAAETFASQPLPTTEEEVWRYSRIGQLDLARYAPVTADANPADREVCGTGGARLVVVDGALQSLQVDPALIAAGVFVGRLVEAPNAGALLGSAMDAPLDVFATMNDAFAAEPLAIVVPRGVTVGGPVVIEHHLRRAGVAVFPRLVVHADENASVRVVEQFTSGAEHHLVVPIVELVAGASARVGYLGVQQLGARAWQLGSVVARAEASATVHASAAALGGDYARLRTDCRLVGRGGTGLLTSLYYGSDDQMLDFRTFQDHAAPDTSSTLLFTGAVDDSSASVYTGLIRVRKTARGTNALQTNRNLKLSDRAWAESVPNLEIENNDVRCKHESSVSPIDADQRFYLESRGVPPEAAERLVVGGFFTEVLERLAVPELRAPLALAISAKLDRLREHG